MMRQVVTVNIWNRCQLKCPYCVSHAPDRSKDYFDDGRDYGEVLDVNALIKWLDKFKPLARVHVSGGEPLYYPGCESWIESLLGAGYDVTILTNGLALPLRRRLHGAPINWIITYHLDCGTSLDDWLIGVRFIQHTERVSLRTIVTRECQFAENIPRITKKLRGYKFKPRRYSGDAFNAGLWGISLPSAGDLARVASHQLALVENSGKVYAGGGCKWVGPVGDVYAGGYDSELAARADEAAAQCASTFSCGAFFTAWTEELGL